MLQITPSFSEKFFFFFRCPELLDGEQQCNNKKKSWHDNFQLGFKPRGSCGFPFLGGLHALAHSFVWYGYCVESLAGGRGMDKMNPGLLLSLKILCFYSLVLTVSL